MSQASRAYNRLTHLYRNVLKKMRLNEWLQERGLFGNDPAATATVEQLEPRLFLNAAPVAVNDAYSVNEDNPLAVVVADGLLDNDTDADSDPLSVVSVDDSSLVGSLSWNSDGSFTYTPAENFNGTDSFTYVASDGTDNSNSATVNITVHPVDDPTILSNLEAAALAYTENDGPVAVTSTLEITDAEGDVPNILTFWISGNYQPGEDFLSVAGTLPGNMSYQWLPQYGSVEFYGGSSLAEYQTAARQVMYENISEDPSELTRTLQVYAIDGNWLPSNFPTREINVTSVNDSPALSYVSNLSYTENDGPVSLIPNVVVEDADDDNIESAVLVFDYDYDPEDVLSFDTNLLEPGMSWSYSCRQFFSWYDQVGLEITGTASKATYQAILRSVTYENTSDDPIEAGATDLRVLVHITDDSQALSYPRWSHIYVTAVNDAPVNNIPGSQVTAEDTDLVFSSAIGNEITISDIDKKAGYLQVTLTATNGTVTLGSTANLISVTGNGTNSLQFTGQGHVINAAMEGMTFSPTLNYNGNASLQITTNDLGNTGIGGALEDTDTVNITVTAVNDAPVAVDDSDSVNENESLTIYAADLLANDTDVEGVTLSIASFTQPTNGAVVDNSDGSFTYTPNANFDGSDSFTYIATDGTDNSNAATVYITVNPAADPPENDAPVNDVPDTQVTDADTNLVFSSANDNAITISDIDAGSADVQVTLTATNGVVTLGGTAGLTSVTGNGTASLVATGSIAEINAAMEGMVFSPTTSYYGGASLQITTNDLGNSGPGGALEDTDIIGIHVRPVGDSNEMTVFTLDGNNQSFTGEDLADALLAGKNTGVVVTDIQLSNHIIQAQPLLDPSDTDGWEISSGIFDNNNDTYDMPEYGIVLSTGDAGDYGSGDNTVGGFTQEYDMYPGPPATAEEEALLDEVTGIDPVTGENAYNWTHYEVTRLDITFQMLEGYDTFYINIVFGSEEYPEFVSDDEDPSDDYIDGLGIFLNEENIAFADAFVDEEFVGPRPININHPQMELYSGTELDGILVGQDEFGQDEPVITLAVTPESGTNTLTFIIADAHDNCLDTTVYISIPDQLPQS